MARETTDRSRRGLIAALAGLPALAVAAPSHARELFSLADLRGTASASEAGLIPGASDDQSRLLQAALDAAAQDDRALRIPPGVFHVSNIVLPARVRLVGTPGASQLVYSGGGHFLISENGSHVEMSGLTIDGANRGLGDYAKAALRITNCEHAVVENCRIVGSTANGLQVERSSGRVERTTVSGARGDCGIYALENRGFSIIGNEVTACSNGGILVHRWQPGEDGTIVSGNRIFNIGARLGGTGQWGNGINVFRADSVMIANNQIADCAFSAIRSNSGGNVQISGNNCLRSGETAIYSEFEFTGAVISGNVVDGAAIGISLANFMQGGRMAVCANNLVRNLHASAPYSEGEQVFGIGISAEADTTITGNVIENAEGFGINLGWGPYLRDVVASSNVIRKADTGMAVSVVEGAGNTVISDNVISGFRTGAIVGHRWKEAVTGDLALAGARKFEHLTIERNRIG